MKAFNKIWFILMATILMVSCQTDMDKLYNFDYIDAPGNVSAVFDITQDNTGLVSIVPNAEGAQLFRVTFGDTENETAEEYNPGETITHVYSEGTFPVSITAIGITGLTSEYKQDIGVTFKAPENLSVSIVTDESNPRKVTVKANADYATVFDVYFGDVQDEDPAHVLPDEEVEHVYAEAGDYVIRIVAKSAGAATLEYTETVTISAASDPVYLPVNFESFTVNYAFTDFGNAFSSVVENPDMSGINTSSRVGQTVKQSGAETWAGSFLTLGEPIDFSVYKTFNVKVWSPKAGATVKLKVENLTNSDIGYEVDATTSVTDEWELLSFDFSGIDTGNEYQKVVLFFDFGNSGDGSLYYFDDIKLVPSSIPPSSIVQDFEGETPAFTVFGNIGNVEVVSNPDATGVNTTSSVAKLVKSEGAETWAGAYFETDSPLDLDNYKKIRVKTWSPKSGAVVKLKLENQDASTTYEVDAVTTVTNSWEELVYDFSEAPQADYMRVVIFFDFGNPGDGTTYYYDEVELINDEAPNPSLVFQDFEGDAPVFTVFGNIAEVEVIANPDASGENTSSMVAKLVKTNGAETWAGSYFELDSPLDLNTFSKLSVKTWSPKSGAMVKVKLENQDSGTIYEVDALTSVTDSWEVLTYDFSEAPVADYMRVVIFFDFGNLGDDAIYYYDDFALTN